MAISSIVRALGRSPLTTELLAKLKTLSTLQLNGIPRLPKGLVASALANSSERNLFVVCATLEEAGRWTTQLETMGWKTIHFYPTSEASPYEPFDPETEMTWGQMQVLADLIKLSTESGNLSDVAVIATQAALQPHLPPPEAFKPFCLNVAKGMEFNLGTFAKKMAALGYERVPLVEMEGTWSRRGDIVDVFPVSSELPVRLDWFGDEIEQIREFDPSTQRSALDKIDSLILTPTSFAPILMADEDFKSSVENYLSPEEKEKYQQLIANQFLVISKQKEVFDQIRIVNISGEEKVRVNFNQGKPAIVPKKYLQNQSQRYWFQNSLDLEEGEVFISPMDLNVERGQIEQPIKPMIRFTTPIFEDGKMQGMVILNYLAQDILNKLEQEKSTTLGQTFLLNAQGYWLKSTKPQDEWGFMYEEGKNITFENRFPEVWKQISNLETGQLNTPHGLFSFTTIYPLEDIWSSDRKSTRLNSSHLVISYAVFCLKKKKKKKNTNDSQQEKMQNNIQEK